MILLRLSFFLLLSYVPAKAYLTCENYKTPESYHKIRKNIDKEIDKFVLNKAVVQESDSILDKLTKAKSPVIISWLNKPEHAGKSEEELVKLWRHYYAKNILLAKYPHENPTISREMAKTVDRIVKTNFKTSFKKRMQKIFSQVKSKAKDVIVSYRLQSEKVILDRVNQIELYWPEKFAQAKNNSSPLDVIEWGIAYSPVENKINMGVLALLYPNDETYYSVFAHEIAHSFDSCRWGAFFEGEWPFAQVGDCLRTEKSIQAKKRDDSQLEILVKSGKLSQDLALGLKSNSTCTKTNYPPLGVQADQLPESFADWFSAEVIADFSKLSFKNIRQDLCEEKKLIAGSSYPTNKDRLEKIYFAHPLIKQKLAIAEANDSYCKYLNPLLEGQK